MGWRTVQALSVVIRKPEYQQYLINRLLCRSEGLMFDETVAVQMDLIGIGALAIRGRKVEISSPLVRAIIMRNIGGYISRKPDFMPIFNGLLDVPLLIRYNFLCLFLSLDCPFCSFCSY